MHYTIADVGNRNVNGLGVVLSDAEKQVIADEWNAAEAESSRQAAAEEAERLRLQNLKGDALAADLIARLKTTTPTQISNYVDANVNLTDPVSIRTMFKRVLLVLALIANGGG